MNLRSLLHRKTKMVPLLPAEGSGIDAESAATPKQYRRKRANGALEERWERLLTPTELDLVQHHRI
ncbi:hypothetical protein D7D52_29400 [Nocardia yunnanensis]|uniref:Uncharacterized protein n=1 Tax=Nocardia yunnanensis TaxID=2382165 RepID=A0A386ZI84_9NOCA|nr:hypothetical protein [Nocardia yunnanensis]AYF77257.1 hypothetical protein D7D52_29400 [Nocardia yunnanensis]